MKSNGKIIELPPYIMIGAIKRKERRERKVERPEGKRMTALERVLKREIERKKNGKD